MHLINCLAGGVILQELPLGYYAAHSIASHIWRYGEQICKPTRATCRMRAGDFRAVVTFTWIGILQRVEKLVTIATSRFNFITPVFNMRTSGDHCHNPDINAGLKMIIASDSDLQIRNRDAYRPVRAGAGTEVLKRRSRLCISGPV